MSFHLNGFAPSSMFTIGTQRILVTIVKKKENRNDLYKRQNAEDVFYIIINESVLCFLDEIKLYKKRSLKA